ncbi:MAG: hypothetical protein A2Z07_10925 [Armatimonadetes bacterium RBG_16_67_12]|nr:MAG: hypothetical protein A2Z07_10925 [Armatimonadetes bacterium RBG_16_67_12]
MFTRLLPWFAVCVLVLAAVTPAPAMQTRTGPAGRVGPSEDIDDDLYVAAGVVTVDGRVRGDLVAAGGTVSANGQVEGGVLAAGGTVDISGRVGASVRALGGTVFVRGTVGTDVVAAGGTIILESNARVTRDLAAAGGNVTLQGTVGRDAHLAGGRVEIAGSVAGNVLARADEVVVLPSAVIRGNLTYSSQKPAQIAPGARVIGRILQEPYLVRPMPSREIVRGFRIAFGVADFFWMLIIAMVLAAVAPGGLQQTADALHRRPWASLGWGTFLLITVPIAIVALVVMLIGIPLGVLLLVAHTLALFVSHASAGLAIGQTLAPRLKSRYAEVAIGVGVIAIATSLPYVGWFLRLIAVAVGLGALVLALWAQREQSPPPARPIPVGPAVA